LTLNLYDYSKLIFTHKVHLIFNFNFLISHLIVDFKYFNSFFIYIKFFFRKKNIFFNVWVCKKRSVLNNLKTSFETFFLFDNFFIYNLSLHAIAHVRNSNLISYSNHNLFIVKFLNNIQKFFLLKIFFMQKFSLNLIFIFFNKKSISLTNLFNVIIGIRAGRGLVLKNIIIPKQKFFFQKNNIFIFNALYL